MTDQAHRLGDVIDDYCSRCRLLLNHAIAGMVEGKVMKVVCQTCHTEHPYRHANLPPKKKATPRQALFEQVLSKAAPVTAAARETEPEPVAAPEAPPPPKKKSVSPPARYISRHKGKPPHRRH